MSEPLDQAAVLARYENDRELVREMVRLFHESSVAWLAEVRAALERGDLSQAQRAAHTLKGSVGNFLARDAAAAAARVEQECRAGNVQAAQTAFSALAEEAQRLNAALNSLLTA